LLDFVTNLSNNKQGYFKGRSGIKYELFLKRTFRKIRVDPQEGAKQAKKDSNFGWGLFIFIPIAGKSKLFM